MKTILNARKVIACDGSNPINNGSVIIEGDRSLRSPLKTKLQKPIGWDLVNIILAMERSSLVLSKCIHIFTAVLTLLTPTNT